MSTYPRCWKSLCDDVAAVQARFQLLYRYQYRSALLLFSFIIQFCTGYLD